MVYFLFVEPDASGQQKATSLVRISLK